ncbi:flagellar hook-associated protein FlgK [Pseudoduganella violaceinigra]|uniref:flagellar hook-associated protein FlgK n=1 Tax=Pseudoduganella violaceinigra TaxID=246602 RepID=UPI000481BEC6|nr:flagellar hook-associated protein FlgK [Pseudoduganella violaceinigra]
MSSLLSIGKSGLLAAQTGLATTGHNITNSNVTGYNRQVVVQGTTPPLQTGDGFVGTGTEVAQIKRVYDDFLNRQLLGAQTNQSQLDTYFNQVSQIDNLLADTTVGLSPALQDFFKGVQNANSSPQSPAARQALLSSAQSLASRFNGISARMKELQQGVNTGVAASVNEINSFARRIADLNNTIAGLSVDPSALPSDLMDQRDALIAEMNKQVKVTVMPAENNMLNVSFGTGQPLVVGNRSQVLATANSPSDPERIVVGYQTNGNFSQLPDSVLIGGQLGGLIDFRNSGLDVANASLGKVAAGLADAFNDQHKLGLDLNSQFGGNFFNDIHAYVGYDNRNAPTSTVKVDATIVDAAALTTSDYDINYNGTDFIVTRASDGATTTIAPYPQAQPQVIDGVAFSITGAAGGPDHFLVRPTYNAAQDISVALKDPNKIALAAPISTSVPTTNTGNGKISPGAVNANYLLPGNQLAAPVTLTYNSGTNQLSGFPAGSPVDVTVNGTTTTYPAGTPVPYTAGAQIAFQGIEVSLSGTPANNDKFTIAPGSGVGDARNGVLLAGLQSKNILDGGHATFQGSYAQMVNFVGNKTREVQIASSAADTAVVQAQAARDSVSGVNLDEEAANLLRYQQAYQASGKVIQVANTLFDTLLSLNQ